jgi:hypothetical protein
MGFSYEDNLATRESCSAKPCVQPVCTVPQGVRALKYAILCFLAIPTSQLFPMLSIVCVIIRAFSLDSFAQLFS